MREDILDDASATDRDQASTEVRTTEMPCMVCLTTISLDDDRPRFGTVRWEVFQYFRLRRGRALSFHCPQGHSSDGDPDLLKAFPSRTF
jgi:hypothetical protein